jgi:arylsulfatase A-like enzyme
MRILYLDIDTLRADHLGCYGYLRDTSPNIDRIAAQAARFQNCYVSDAPCLPSRASLFTGRFGIHTGVVGHGGTAADLRLIGRERGFDSLRQRPGLVWCLRERGLYPVSISPFAERHSAWWFYEGWREMVNTGRGGMEGAEEVGPLAIDWIRRNARRQDWVLHVNLWDPHTPYRAPEDFGNPFADAPLETWYTEDLRRRQWESFGPGSPQEPAGSFGAPSRHARQGDRIASMDDYKKWIDGYDCGVRHADEWCGRILGALAEAGVLDETVVIITSDHGENLGELAVIGDHSVADHVTSRVPFILRWPGMGIGRVDEALHYQNDLAATIVELAGGRTPGGWDGRSLAAAFRAGREEGRPYLVASQCAWACMRAVRWDRYMFIRSYHTALKNYPARMLFDVAADPHELQDLAPSRPDLADHAQALLERWTAEMMAGSESAEDPLWRVMREGGPYHTRGRLEAYCERLRATGRARHADFLAAHPTGLADA